MIRDLTIWEVVERTRSVTAISFALRYLSFEHTELNLFRCQIRQVPEVIRRFSNLRSLCLSGNPLEKETFCWLEVMTKLEELDLSGCTLWSFPPSIQYLTNLQVLELQKNNLSINSLNDIPFYLGTFENLRSLNLANNYPGNKLEILYMLPKDLALFIKQRAKDKQAVYRERIMLVGLEMAGKTSLVHRLMNRDQNVPKIPLSKRTFGVMTHSWKGSDIVVNVTTREGIENHNLDVEFWDFAGHTVFYPTHHLFLTSNVIYLLVFSWEWADTHEVSGIAKILEVWVRRIRSQGIHEPILLVGTHSDCSTPRKIKYCLQQLGYLLSDEVKRGVVHEEFNGRIIVVSVANTNSSEEGSGMRELKKWIATLAQRARRRIRLGEEFPTSYLEVERKMRQYLNEIQLEEAELEEASRVIAGFELLHSKYSESCYMVFEEFQQQFAPKMSEEDVRAMLSFFHLSGLVLWRSPQLNHSHRFLSTQDAMEVDEECENQEMVFLDPQWLMRELIPLVNFLLDKKLKNHRGGLLSSEELESHYDHLPPLLRKRVPELLKWFQLAIRTEVEEEKNRIEGRKSVKEKEEVEVEEGGCSHLWFIPLQLQPWDNKLDGDFLFNGPKKGELREYQLEISFVPDGFMALLFFQLYELGPQSCFRRDKCILRHKTDRGKVSSLLSILLQATFFPYTFFRTLISFIEMKFRGVGSNYSRPERESSFDVQLCLEGSNSVLRLCK
jgi:GTPase SAR1 family protein